MLQLEEPSILAGLADEEAQGQEALALGRDHPPDRRPSEFTTDLLELLRVLGATVAEYPGLPELLEVVVSEACFAAGELAPVPDAGRRPPGRTSGKGLFAEYEDGE